MRGFWPIFKRELFAFFVTPLAWVLVTVFLVVQGMHFYLIVDHFSSQPEISGVQTPLQAFFGNTVLLYLVLFLLVPPLTMRLFSEERRSGTIEALMTAPVSPAGVVLAKYAAALVVYVFMWAPTALYVVILRRSGAVDLRVVLATYLGVLVVGAGYLAVGLLASAVTKSQFLAFLFSAVVILALFVLGIGEFVAREGTTLHAVCAHVSVWAHMNDFSSGVVDTRRLVFYGALTVVPLFAAVRLVDSWRWDGARVGAIVGVVAAVVCASLGNLVATRHFWRWDVTTTGRYTLSPPTKETLRDLPEQATLWVLLSPGDPLGQSLRQLLVGYQAESPRVVVKYIDPDRDPLGFEDVKRRFKIEAGRAADGRLVTDAAIVVAMGDRHWFVTTQDLLEVSDRDQARVKPREEQALTHAIRSVTGGERTEVCFTEGHGELALEDGSDRGVGHLREILDKDNFRVRAIDLSVPTSTLESCRMVLVAGPRSPFSKDEDRRLATWLARGGSLLVASSPTRAPGASTFSDDGLAASLATFGVATEQALVVEEEPARVLEAEGVGFVAEARVHGITSGLVKDSGKFAPRIKVKAARPFAKLPGDVVPADVAWTSPRSFAMRDVKPSKDHAPGDLAGPLVIAVAGERPKVAAYAAHGPRLVALGSTGFLAHAQWQEPLADRGAALLVENAISWLTARPAIVDVPERADVPAGMRLTEASRVEIRDYVLFYMPAAAGLLGLAIALRRRSTEGKAPKKR